ncbi:hypothetical protein MHH_c00620 [Mannheimia haemolytica M42548]|nr:hypothetical protein MHH_c00620 [Mannheimia haemolytica M42548]
MFISITSGYFCFIFCNFLLLFQAKNNESLSHFNPEKGKVIVVW